MKSMKRYLWFLLAAMLFAVMAGGCGGGGGDSGDVSNPGGGSGNLAGVWHMTSGVGTWISNGLSNESFILSSGTWKVDANYSIDSSSTWDSGAPFTSWNWSAQNYATSTGGATYMTSNGMAGTIRVEVLIYDENSTEASATETITMNDGSTVKLEYVLTKQP